jgi:hypothetical protein
MCCWVLAWSLVVEMSAYSVVPKVSHVRSEVAGGVKVTLLFVAYERNVELTVVCCPFGPISTTGMTVAVTIVCVCTTDAG